MSKLFNNDVEDAIIIEEVKRLQKNGNISRTQSFEIMESIALKNKDINLDKDSKHSKFLHLSFSSLQSFNAKYKYFKGKVFYTIGLSVGKTVKSLKDVLSLANSGVEIFHNKTNEIREEYLLFGQKSIVLMNSKKITEELKKLNIDFSLLTYDKDMFSIDPDALKNFLITDVFKTGIEAQDKNMTSKVLENSDKQTKEDIFTKIIWKRLKENISHSMSLIIVADRLKNNDPHIKNIKEVAKNNLLSEEALLTIINSDPALLTSLKGGHLILSNLDKHIQAINKYTEFVNACSKMSSFYCETASSLLGKYFSDNSEFIESITQDRFLTLNGKSFNLFEILKNVQNTEIAPLIRKNPESAAVENEQKISQNFSAF